MATTLIRTRPQAKAVQDDRAYYYLLSWLRRMDPDPLKNASYRTQTGRWVDTLDELCRAVEDGEFIPVEVTA